MSTPTHEYEWDVFVSHAREDKGAFVRDLVVALRNCGLRVWFDEDILTIGDSLRRSIDAGLLKSRFGAVVLSPSFFKKEWTRKELDALVARDDGREKVILPIWHDVSFDEVMRFSPLLADKLAFLSSQGAHTVSRAIAALVFAEAGKQRLPVTLQKVRWGRVDGKPAGITVEMNDGQSFIPWEALQAEIEACILPQMDHIPSGCIVGLRTHEGKTDWVVRVLEPDGTEAAHIWFGPDPGDDWTHDGLIRVGLPKDPLEVWHTFARYSDGSYRKTKTK